MNSIKIAVTFFLLVLCLNGYSQNTGNTEIRTKLDAMIELTNQKKYDQVFDLMYPKLFGYVSKSDLIDLMTSMNQDGLTLRISDYHINNTSAPFQDGTETFVRVDYSAKMELLMEDGSLYDSPKAAQAMLEQFQHMHGEGNVAWSPEEKKYTIAADRTIIAVKQEGSNDWYLVEVSEQKELMDSIFPEAVLQQLVNSK